MASYPDSYGALGASNANQKILEMVEQGKFNFFYLFGTLFRQKNSTPSSE
jgi:hypothetical protein